MVGSNSIQTSSTQTEDGLVIPITNTFVYTPCYTQRVLKFGILAKPVP